MGSEKIWKIAIVGLGSIADESYMPQMHRNKKAEVVACCDIMPERAADFSKKHGIAKTYVSVDDLLAYEDFDILMDTASIPAHYEINKKALKAGKHLYSQKPISLTVGEATDLIETAKASKVKFAASPIHALRPDIQEGQRLIKQGILGKVNLVRAINHHGGPEYFQYRINDPSWFHEPGAGALYDLAVHSLHQVTALLGPAKSVSCMAVISEPRRTVRSGNFNGKLIESNKLYDNYMINLDFGEGTVANVMSGYCVKATTTPSLEVYGECGSIIYTREHGRSMSVYIDEPERKIRGWLEQMPQERPGFDFYQCYCITDLIQAIEEDRDPILRPEHARHVIDIMCNVEQAAADGTVHRLETVF